MSKVYNTGTEAQFDTWHNWACHVDRANIPPGGKVNFTKGKLAPSKQKTTAYSYKTAHSTNANLFIWPFLDFPDTVLGLTEYTELEAYNAGFKIEEPI